ncbi:putative bifunctional diguanylate cyclase/phosphodiesterase [Bacillus pinisoli]|uniref:putative bifunctional diguanylate cyclase/phosphodiesterase n=1 Tax=Bacillus pinisoli TaxID=2901866 RepID=UPI001FF3CF07|nr:bifunctional diguanylate cyclase/phosphodiesterase [Bacillus pinisoli]
MITKLSEFNAPAFESIKQKLGGEGCFFGIALYDQHNRIIGTLCGLDTKPYAFTEHQMGLAMSLGHLLSQTIIMEGLLIKDTLTNLYNRHFASSYLEYEKNEIFALIYMDIDRFKLINDSYGHHMGDQVIVKIAERIERRLGPEGIACRMGGDELLIIHPKAASLSVNEYLYEVERLAEEFITIISEPILIQEIELSVSVSIGISLYPLHAKDMITLLKNADMAMYKAKRNGTKIEVYDRHQGKTLARQLMIENEMRKALERNQFTLHYQSQYDLQTGKLKGFEALIRWDHPLYGWISPGEFIPVAEETGLIVPLGEWVIKQVCEDGVKWLERGGQPVHFSLNISSEQIKSKRFVERVQAIIKKSGFEPSMLKFEITESIFMNNMDIAVQIITRLKETGLWTALDDFGTGYSSLSYIKHLPIDCLKIDRVFINEILESKGDQAIVKAMITLSNELGVGVVAEGIENEQQHEYLRESGCHIGQGFYYQRPVPFDTICSKYIQIET